MTRDTGHPTDAGARLQAAVAREIARQADMQLGAGLYLVATPIGNLGDITLRALSVLARADLICCEDTRHSRKLLDHFAIEGPIRSYHEHNAEAERPHLLALIAGGKAIALISDAGTPLVSDPGYKLVRAVIEAGHEVQALPGASAMLAGLVVSGLPSDTVLFAGFLPAKEGARRSRLAALAALPATLVLFEAPTRLERTLADIGGVVGAREVVVARELTKRFEKVRRGTARDLAAWAAATEIKGEIVILLAPPGEKAEASDGEIVAALAAALAEASLKDAARAVAEQFGVPRSRVYQLGLSLKAATGVSS